MVKYKFNLHCSDGFNLVASTFFFFTKKTAWLKFLLKNVHSFIVVEIHLDFVILKYVFFSKLREGGRFLLLSLVISGALSLTISY